MTKQIVVDAGVVVLLFAILALSGCNSKGATGPDLGGINPDIRIKTEGFKGVVEAENEPSNNSLEVKINPERKNRLEMLRAEVERLDAMNEYKLAYIVIAKEMAPFLTYDVMEYAIAHAERHLHLLQRYNTYDSLSEFKEPYNYMKKRANEKAREQQFHLRDENEILDVTGQYEVMKEAVKLYKTIVENNYPLEASQEELTRYLTIKEKINILREALLSARCDYISYAVISPFLAETHKLLFISQRSKLAIVSHDKITTDKAVSLLAKSFHKGWLYESHECIRMQFINVLKRLKSMVGKEEYEEYKTLTTLLDSYDSSKSRGMEGWW